MGPLDSSGIHAIFVAMDSGIRVTVSFPEAAACPIARVSASVEAPITQVSTSVTSESDAGSVTEFIAAADADDVEFDAIFPYGDTTVFRTDHGSTDPCPCQCLGEFGCPVYRYTASDGTLTLIFHCDSFEQLQTVMATMRDRFTGVDVKQLLRPPLEGPVEDQVFVNRGSLTDRQLEVLQLAYDRGYFERPRQTNATELANELGISQSTVTEHLIVAQRKLLGDLLEHE